MVDLSHLSESSQKRIRDEMNAGRKRLKQHKPAIEAAQRSLEENARLTGQELNVTGQDIIAQQAAREQAERARQEEAAEAQREEALKRHREKEAIDQLESITGRKGFAVNDEIEDAAEQLQQEKTERAENEPQRVNQELGVTDGVDGADNDDAADEAAKANEAQNLKEASDRQQTDLYVESEDNPNFGGYDDNGDPIWKNNPLLPERDNAQVGAESDTADIATVATGLVNDAEAEAVKRGRKGRKPAAAPTQPVGNGPPSE